jgi:hypothetical protein
VQTESNIGRPCEALLVLGLVFAANTARAQQPTSPTLDNILHQLQDNLDQYRKLVPSFYCSEHVVSDANYGGDRLYRATDSIFRVVRNDAEKLIESREVKAINGTPVTRQHLDGPVALGGVFAGGLATVSENGKACMHYAFQPDAPLQPDVPGHPGKYLVVHFSTLPEAQNVSACVLKGEGTGRVLIDPTTLQVTKMELQAPHHALNTGEHGLWKITIDYAPVALGGKTFWMPAILNSTLVTEAAQTPTVYTYFAHYYDYHKLEVTSRVVPGLP